MNHTCSLCRFSLHLDRLTGDIIEETQNFIIIHYQKYPVHILGWLIISPKRHIEDQVELTLEEQQELMSLQMKYTRLIKSKTRSERIYWLMFSEQVPHIHFHLIPRSDDFPSEFRGTAIFDFVADRPFSTLEVEGFCDYLRSSI